LFHENQILKEPSLKMKKSSRIHDGIKKIFRLYFMGLCLTVILAGCSPHRTTVVLVPDPDGRVGTVAVKTQGGEQVLSESGQAVIVKNETDAPPPATRFDVEKIRTMFGKALNAEPPVPEKFILHFKSDSTALLPESEILIPKIINAIQRRASFDISVNGHSDRVGADAYNLDLSLKRAGYVKELIVKAGIDERYITTDSHGEGNPIIPTPDGVAEPLNRRVEVIVR
jgi:outer membrane protein OmpA-like peptidoglycan-associated protein